MKIEVADTFPPELDAVADGAPRATFYHTRAWLESLADAYPRLASRCLIAHDGAAPVAFLPYFVTRRGPFVSLWSLPFGTYGGPVGQIAAAGDLLRVFRSQSERRLVVEAGLVDFHNDIDPTGASVEHASTHVVDLSGGYDTVWRDRFDKSRRRRARRAQEAGVVVRRAAGDEDVRRFVEVYRTRLAGWDARSGHPDALFRALVARGGNRVRLSVAEHTGEVVGGHVNFYYKDAVIAWYGMASRRGDELQAGTLLYAEAMREACEEGFRTYNLGASLGKASLVEYKQSLGGVAHQYRIVRRRSFVGRALGLLRLRRGSP
ncbi:MAG TPA: GNAT family N-acetyltransferase [Candidatus Krumholzibacteria bacterium]|nr:GNAT family N-acetyltransferase [Candidatus Krumholzibacteria bacterium]